MVYVKQFSSDKLSLFNLFKNGQQIKRNFKINHVFKRIKKKLINHEVLSLDYGLFDFHFQFTDIRYIKYSKMILSNIILK